jgi:hypothetical protein
MKFRPILTAVAFASVVFVSCKNSGTSGLPIPKDAAVVVHINSSSLTSKLSWKEIRETNWFREMSRDQKDSLSRQIMENPEASGVDVKSDFAYFMKSTAHGGYMVFEGKIKNAGDFENMVKKMNSGVQVQKDGDLKWIKTESNSILSWNDSKFIYMGNAPEMRQNSPFGNRNMEQPVSTDSLRRYTKDLLAMDKDNSLERDDRFSDLLKQDGDVHFWVSAEQFTSSMGGGMMSMLKMNSLLKGNVATFTLNFDKGRIAVKSRQYFGDEMSKILDKYEDKKVSSELINRIPSQNVYGVMAFNVNPAVIKDVLQVTGMDGMANAYLGQMNYSLDELLGATNGEFLVSVSDFQLNKKQVTIPAYYQGDTAHSFTRTEPDFKVLVAAGVKNRAAFQKLLDLANQNLPPAAISKVNFKLNDQWFVAGNNMEKVDQFLAGGNSNQPFADKITGHPFGLYVDLQKIFKSIGTSMDNAYDTAVYNANVNFWKDVVATGGEYKNKSITSEFSINLVDGSENSLKQLNQYAEKMSSAKKLRPAPWTGTDNVVVDSTVVSPDTE